MAIQVFHNLNNGAPTMSNTIGSLISVLDTILLSGYGQQTASTLTRSGSVATITLPVAHGITRGQTILISGANEPEYNGLFWVESAPTTFSLTFTVTGTPVTPATGTILCKVAPATGWTRPFNGANKAIYRQPSGNQSYLRVDDSAAAHARIKGGLLAQDVDTMTLEFPPESIIAGGCYAYKPNSGNSWVIVTTPTGIMLFIDYTAGNACQPIIFQDLDPTDAADIEASILYCENRSGRGGSGTTTSFPVNAFFSQTSPVYAFFPNRYGYVNTPSYGLPCCPSVTYPTNFGVNNSPLPYPSPFLERIRYTSIYLGEQTGIRGRFRGVYHQVMNTRLLPNRQIFEGGGVDTGKTFMYIYLGTSPAEVAIVEISNTTDWS